MVKIDLSFEKHKFHENCDISTLRDQNLKTLFKDYDLTEYDKDHEDGEDYVNWDKKAVENIIDLWCT